MKLITIFSPGPPIVKKITFKNPLDIPLKKCYTIIVKRIEDKSQTSLKRENEKKLRKPLDKPFKKCYTIIVKGRENKKSQRALSFVDTR